MQNVGMMLTQYESFGSVGMDEYIQYYIDEELEVDAGMICYYNEYLRNNQYYDDEYMNWDELEEYLEGMKKNRYFVGMRSAYRSIEELAETIEKGEFEFGD